MRAGDRSETMAVGAVGAAGAGLVALGLAGLVAGAGPLAGPRSVAAALGGLVALVAAASFALGASSAAGRPAPVARRGGVLAPILLAALFVAGTAAIVGADEAADAEALTPAGATLEPEPAFEPTAPRAVASGPILVESYRGRVSGARLGPLGDVSAPDAQGVFDLILPREAANARIELAWAARPGGSSDLGIAVFLKDNYGDWTTVADVAGPPMIWIDLAKTPGASAPLRIVVRAPEGAAVLDQPFEGFVSSFDGPIPPTYSAAQ